MVAAPQRLPAEDERVDVIFSAVLIVPFLVLLIAYGWLEHGLVGAAAWSLTSLAPHGLVQLLVRRRHLLDERHAALERANASLARKQAEIEEFTYTVAHDLKAPMSAISMTADCLLDGDLADPARDDVTRILRLAGDTENMIVDLLGMVGLVVSIAVVVIGLTLVGDTSVEAAERRSTLVGQLRTLEPVNRPFQISEGAVGNGYSAGSCSGRDLCIG